MITKEFGKYFGACDLCDEETPRFNNWNDCLAYIRANKWQTTKDKDTGEWENYCPVCVQKIKANKLFN